MPLVRIDIIQGRSDEEINKLADTVQKVLIETFAAPELDRYQIIHEHRKGLLKCLDTGLGYERTDKLVILQITQQGRNREQKENMYAAMSHELEKIGVPSTDLIISLSENTKEDWSFGMGRAQFMTGDL